MKFIALVLCLIAAPALAADAPKPAPSPPPAPFQADDGPQATAPARHAPQAPTQPCQRAQSSMKIGGVDMDEVRCTGYMQAQQIAQMSVQMVQMQAQTQLLRSDLDTANARAAELQKALDDAFAKAAELQKQIDAAKK